MTARETLDGIRAQLAAATPGPWKVRECTPCTERGRLEVDVWDESGNLMVTGWCDDDEFHRPDAEFIAAAPSTVARLSNAVEAVLALHEPITHHFLTPPAGSVEVCHSCREEYPCPTVAAIENALKEGQ